MPYPQQSSTCVHDRPLSLCPMCTPEPLAVEHEKVNVLKAAVMREHERAEKHWRDLQHERAHAAECQRQWIHWENKYNVDLHRIPELKRQIERLFAERDLVASDEVHYWQEHENGPIVLCVSANDVFAFACADAEKIPDSEFWDVYKIWKEHGSAGLTAWVIERRGMEPFEPFKEPFQSKIEAARQAIRRPKWGHV